MSDKPLIKQLFDFDSTPVKSGAFAGMAIGALIVVGSNVLLLNGAVIGMVSGVVAKIRQSRDA